MYLNRYPHPFLALREDCESAFILFMFKNAAQRFKKASFPTMPEQSSKHNVSGDPMQLHKEQPFKDYKIKTFQIIIKLRN